MAVVKALRRNGAGYAQIGSADRILGHAGVARVAVADVAYTAQPMDVYIGVASLTAQRTITLPAASAFQPGQALYIADESGNCSQALLLMIAAAGSDTIAGAASVTMGSPFQKLTFHSNGTNLWTVA